MANMDYPGPCFSCSAIEGCGSDAQRKEAVGHYCKGLELELNSWKTRLYDVLVEVDKLDSSSKAKVDDTLNLIKSTVRELETVKDKLESECPASFSDTEKGIGGKLETIRTNYTKALEVISPGWFGG